MADGIWWRHGVFYQIYPRSFQDSNGDGIGDLPGITARLDHLNGAPGSLGVDAIWISPFYPSPMDDFGYDVSDHKDVHPNFGTLADFDRLLAEAHRRGIRVIVDLVPNHTSDQHPWFVEARASRGSGRRDWYIWADPKPDGSRPNNWRSVFDPKRRPGSAWTLDHTSGQYYLHHFLPSQPDLNWWNGEVRSAIEDVMRFWLDRGVDGFRVDVAHGLIKDPALRDNPKRRGRQRELHEKYDWDRPEVHEIHRSWRRLLDSYGERMAVGEIGLRDVTRMARYYGANDELHLSFNFAFLHQPWRAEAFRREVARFERAIPPGSWPNYTLSNHDQPRHISRYARGSGDPLRRDGRLRHAGPLGGRDLAHAQARARVAATMLLTLRGTPFLYYGEEIGMTHVPVPKRREVDVAGRDPERTPMQWDGSAKADFTSGDPWLPIPAARGRATVEAQRDDPRSLLSLYRRLIALRRASPALHGGTYRALRSPTGVFAYLREAGGELVLVALNFHGRPRTVRLPIRAEATLVLSTDPDRAPAGLPGRELRLAPDEGAIVALR